MTPRVSRSTVTVVLGLVGGAAGLAGCTSLLGDFTSSSSSADAGSPDGTVLTEAGGMAPEGGEGGQGDGGGEAGGRCAQLVNGAICGDGGVCNAGECVACAVGADCSEAGSCQKSVTACSTGAPVCVAAGNMNDGTPCGGPDAGMYCQSGTCGACLNGGPCTPTAPTGNPCDKGSAVCTNGALTACTDTQMPAPPGTSCGTNMVCSGTGSCAACTANTGCNPGGNLCAVGVTDCSTGTQTCKMTGTLSDGSNCGSGGTCRSGQCGCGTGMTSCPAGCVSLGSDTQNCGACAHGCGQGQCLSSACQSWALGSFTALANADLEILSDGKYVVVSDGSSISEFEPNGTSIQLKPAPGFSAATLTATPIFPAGLGGGNVGWFGLGGGPQYGVNSAAEGVATGTSIGTIAASTLNPMDLALDPQGSVAFVLGVDTSTSQVGLYPCQLASTSCSPELLPMSATSSALLRNLHVVNPNSVFFTDTDSSKGFWGIVHLTPMTSATPTTFPTPSQSFSVFAYDSTSMYWVQSGSIMSLPQNFTATSLPTALGSPGTITSMASDGTNLYFGIGSTIQYMPVGGSTTGPLTLHTETGVTFAAMTTAGGFIYWLAQTGTSLNYTVEALALP